MITRWTSLRDRDWDMIHFYWWPLFHPIGALKRWLWTTCPRCGRGFTLFCWPSFDGVAGEQTRQRWFHSETRIYHGPCLAAKDKETRGW